MDLLRLVLAGWGYGNDVEGSKDREGAIAVHLGFGFDPEVELGEQKGPGHIEEALHKDLGCVCHRVNKRQQ